MFKRRTAVSNAVYLPDRLSCDNQRDHLGVPVVLWLTYLTEILMRARIQVVLLDSLSDRFLKICMKPFIPTPMV